MSTEHEHSLAHAMRHTEQINMHLTVFTGLEKAYLEALATCSRQINLVFRVQSVQEPRTRACQAQIPASTIVSSADVRVCQPSTRARTFAKSQEPKHGSRSLFFRLQSDQACRARV